MTGEAIYNAVNAQVPCEQLLLGVLDSASPKPDEVLAVRGLSDERTAQWLTSQSVSNCPLRSAQKQGLAVFSPAEATASGMRGLSVLIAVTPEAIVDGHWWTLLLARKGAPFTEAEQRMAQLIVSAWQARFAAATEAGMGRVLVGCDGRLIAADLGTRTRLLRDPSQLPNLLGVIHPVIEQRWPTMPLQVTRDLAVSLDDHLLWVTIRRDQPLTTPQSQRRYIELRPLQKDELPAVGLVEDVRVAQALAYLHENFHRTPSLAQVAKAMHVSPFHFHRLFTREVTLSPKQYLLRKQLQVAKWMLRATRTPIGTIAQKTGFASHGHFTSTFRRFVNISPSQYRERH
jgi:AraC-like DNA-binding protein